MARQKHARSLADALALGQPLTLFQCSEFLQTSVRTVQRLVTQGMPHFSCGTRSPRFEVQAVQNWLGTELPVLQKQSGGLHPTTERRLHS